MKAKAPYCEHGTLMVSQGGGGNKCYYRNKMWLFKMSCVRDDRGKLVRDSATIGVVARLLGCASRSTSTCIPAR